MATSLMPEMTGNANGVLMAALTKRQQCEIARAQAETERTSFISHWKELTDFIRPRRGRFYVSDVNKGDRRNQKIVDSTPTFSARSLSAGMMAGVTSPARPWKRLTTADPATDAIESVKEWLYEVNRRMDAAFAKSNLYNALPTMYGDAGVFGTSAMIMLEDDEQVFRFYPFAIGSYSLANDEKQRVRSFFRVFRLTVMQIVQRWGNIDPKTGRPDFASGRPTTVSIDVQNQWNRGNKGTWIDIVHVIQPNLSYDGRKIDSKYKQFESIYYELGTPNGTGAAQDAMRGLLAHEGFDEFPVFCLRWEVNAEDVYGTDCPGMTALGDIKELMRRTRTSATAQELMIKPPMTAPTSLRTARLSIMPGDVSFQDVNNEKSGFRPIYEVDFGAAFGPLETVSQQIRQRIQRAFYEDLFLMLSESDRREITAREVDERHEEKLLALGPMLEQLNQDLLDPMIDRAFNIMYRKGLLPPAPPELQGATLRVEYISIMAQAQKMVGVASLERFAGFAGQVAQTDPSVLDVINGDEMIRDHADAMGIPPKIVRPEDAVAQLRSQRQAAAAQQQAAENAPGIAGAVRDLSQSPVNNDSALATLVGKARARQTLNATAQPVQAPI